MDNITELPATGQEQPLEELADKTERAVRSAGGRAGIVERFSRAQIQLSKPFTWCGRTYEQVQVDFERLTGADMEAVDDELAALGLRVSAPADDRRYQRILAARASGVPADAIEHMPLADYNAIVSAARYFLLVTG